MNPIRQMSAMRHTVPGVLRAAKGLVKKEFDFNALLNAPKTRFNGTVSPHRMFDAKTFKLKDVKRIRALAEGSKLNDVMLSVVGGAMREYLDHYNELPDTSVTTMAPISVRDESEKNTMGNQVAAMFVPLGSHIPSAQERMKYVTEETVKAKTFTNALGARQMTEMAKLAPAPVMNLGSMIYSRLKLADHVKPFINTVVTNVPGPPVPIYSAGAKLIGLHGMLCLVVPDPDYYSECLQRSFDAHLEAAIALEDQAKAKAAALETSKTQRKKPAVKARKVSTKTVKTKTIKTKAKKPATNATSKTS